MTGQNEFAARLARIEGKKAQAMGEPAYQPSLQAHLAEARPDIGQKKSSWRMMLLNGVIALGFLAIAGTVFVYQLNEYYAESGRKFFVKVEQDSEPSFFERTWQQMFGETEDKAARTGDLIKRQAPGTASEG